MTGLLILLFSPCIGCVPHKIMGRTADGVVYKVPHTITKEIPADDQDKHSFQPEMSDDDKEALEGAGQAFIAGKGWTSDQVNQTSRPTSKYDCHGLTLDDGKSFIDNKYAEDLARYYGYKPISQCLPASDPKEGDIVVYRDPAGKITHSGRVIGKKGQVIRVRSKWGYWADYEHDIEKVLDSYGKPEVWRKCR